MTWHDMLRPKLDWMTLVIVRQGTHQAHGNTQRFQDIPKQAAQYQPHTH